MSKEKEIHVKQRKDIEQLLNKLDVKNYAVQE